MPVERDLMDRPSGRTPEYITAVRDVATKNEERSSQFEWLHFDQIGKVSTDRKRTGSFNPQAEIGELIFSQEFDLEANQELTWELHEGMEETIGVPEGATNVDVELTTITPLTREETIHHLRKPGDEVVISPYTIHRTRNLSKDADVTLTASGIKTQEGGGTIKNPDVKEIFNPNQVAICMATKYPDWTEGPTDLSNETRTRGYLGLGLIMEAAQHGYRVVVSDGGSSEAFLEQLKQFPNVTVIHEAASFGKQKRAAIQEAAQMEGVKFLLRIEPEKVDTVAHLPALIEPILQGHADVVVGKRRDPEFRESYPDYGYELENGTNQLMNDQLRTNGILPPDADDLDLYSGLIVFRNSPEIVKLFETRYKYAGTDEINPMVLEGWMHAQVYGPILALHRGYKVKQVEVPFWYAGLQKLNEMHPEKIESFIEKRKKQQEIGELGVKLLAETLSGRNPLLVEE